MRKASNVHDLLLGVDDAEDADRAPRNASPFRPNDFPSDLGKLLPWLLPILLVVFWEIGARNGWIAARFLPAPSTVALAFWVSLANGTLLDSTLISIQRALYGLVIGGGIGFAVGVVGSELPIAGKLSDPLQRILRSIPHLACIPLMILWLGTGGSATLFLIAIAVFIPVTRQTFHGIRAIDPDLIEMGRAYGLRPLALYTRVILPGALPAIFIGLRQALAAMWLTLIAAELVTDQAGIGAMMMKALGSRQVDVLLLGILVYALLASLADLAVRRLERFARDGQPTLQMNTMAVSA